MIRSDKAARIDKVDSTYIYMGLSFFWCVELLQKAEGGTSPNHTPESYPESYPRIIPLKTYAARC